MRKGQMHPLSNWKELFHCFVHRTPFSISPTGAIALSAGPRAGALLQAAAGPGGVGEARNKKGVRKRAVTDSALWQLLRHSCPEWSSLMRCTGPPVMRCTESTGEGNYLVSKLNAPAGWAG
eukprot:1136508-Pelagomonas_calceolata.AAC.3